MRKVEVMDKLFPAGGRVLLERNRGEPPCRKKEYTDPEKKSIQGRFEILYGRQNFLSPKDRCTCLPVGKYETRSVCKQYSGVRGGAHHLQVVRLSTRLYAYPFFVASIVWVCVEPHAVCCA